MYSTSNPNYHYTGDKPPKLFNLARYCLAQSASNFPDKTGLITATTPDGSGQDNSWTYSELEKIILTGANSLLQCGIEPGERLLIRLDNTAEYAFLFLSACAAGIIPIPTSSQLSAREIAYIIEDARPSAIAVDHSLAMPELAASIKTLEVDEVFELLISGSCGTYAATHHNDPAYLIYTSGTSGNPKGVLHAHRAVWGRRPMYEGWYAITPDDIILHAGAFNWTYTLGTGLFDPWANGATPVVYTGQPTPMVWPQLISTKKATIFAAVPGVYRQILKYNDNIMEQVSCLRHGLVAGEPLPSSVAIDWERETGTKLYEAFGMSEISTYISSSPLTGIKPGSPGKVQKGRSIAIIPPTGDPIPLPPHETGLIGIHKSDPGLMLRYWNQEQSSETSFRGDWFCGGDLGQLDEDGYFWFKGRADDLMNAQGYRVSPVEIEQIMVQYKNVSEAAVAEIHVREDLSIIVGFIVVAEDCHVSDNDLIAYLNQNLADYKCPKKIIIVKILPRSANGKLLRKQLGSLFKQNSQ
jgi:acyl-coenzyme A synthetase/AMP-(fatty) acid ligase